MGSAPSHISELFSKPSRPTRFSNQFNIIRINIYTEVGRLSLATLAKTLLKLL